MDDQTFPAETTHKHESKTLQWRWGVHNETTSLLTLSGFSGANRLSSGTAISDPQSRDNDIIFTC